MPPIDPASQSTAYLKELSSFQSALFDKASNYTKLIMGLGYGGFFAVWSGTKQHLSPRLLVGSALLVTLSLVLYIVFEIYQAMLGGYLSFELGKALSMEGADASEALQRYRTKTLKLQIWYFRIWKILFPVTALTGLAGAGSLIYAFIASLLRMYAASG